MQKINKMKKIHEIIKEGKKAYTFYYRHTYINKIEAVIISTYTERINMQTSKYKQY